MSTRSSTTPPRGLRSTERARGLDDESEDSVPLASSPAFAGALGVGVGEKLLMHVFAEAITGRIVVEAPANAREAETSKGPVLVGTIYCVRGEPVHAEPTAGDAVLRGKLGEYDGIPPGANVRDTVRALARSGMPPVRLLEALRDIVRDATRGLIHARAGQFELYVDAQPPDDIPLVAVSPFGLVLDSRRRALPPEELLRLGDDFAHCIPVPRPGLASVGPRIRSFTGGADVARVIDGTRTVADIYTQMGLPPIMGGLVLATLAQTGLIELGLRRTVTPLPQRPGDAKRNISNTPLTTLPVTLSEDHLPLSELAKLGQRGGQDLLTLYLELKPERDVAALFGADVRGMPGTLERAYEARLAQIDPRVIGEGRARPYLLARVEELRDKLERAYRKLSTSSSRNNCAYMLLDRIGAGGMAEVYRARSTEDGRIVAVKRISPENRDDADFARDLLDEARLARRVRHPNVVRVLTAGKSGDELYLAMEYVDGSDLHGLLRDYKKQHGKHAPMDVVVRIVAGACGGLQAAHAAHDDRGVVTPILHRDVSPQNILVSLRGEAKLTDFGIARAASDAISQEGPGPLKGKLPYLAPELVMGAPASVLSDVYAMGMTLYTSLARAPFVRESPFHTLQAICSATLPPPSHFRPDLPAELDAIALRACAREPAQRYASALELQIELEQYLTKRPSVDVGAWVRGALKRDAAPPMTVDEGSSKTVPINELSLH